MAQDPGPAGIIYLPFVRRRTASPLKPRARISSISLREEVEGRLNEFQDALKKRLGEKN